jgi:hypothetical protein
VATKYDSSIGKVGAMSTSVEIGLSSIMGLNPTLSWHSGHNIVYCCHSLLYYGNHGISDDHGQIDGPIGNLKHVKNGFGAEKVKA